MRSRICSVNKNAKPGLIASRGLEGGKGDKLSLDVKWIDDDGFQDTSTYLSPGQGGPRNLQKRLAKAANPSRAFNERSIAKTCLRTLKARKRKSTQKQKDKQARQEQEEEEEEEAEDTTEEEEEKK
ncbi:hypothetical protein MGYG_08886 [Nannizzia gypsea CBS 118893]|uniref:Uncharacterized protein n=1 Tax=Arthroderma gypseum (strain ATCC MYA-4604 / CBS 118893) TaxID=535722 RepID=E5QYA7_ARTGP|nr:hypothetical protein MGYG_08886 [Nannizzia gypsea CBS 118893]EFQ97199.1 hypothetical protein MGYG_08886 [Nannizzia gypsea CBS 118893]